MIQGSDHRQWAELWAAFDELVELEAAARAERLAEIGATNPAARQALEELLEADASSGARLSHIDTFLGTSADRDLLELAGRTVGHFRVVEPLAAGGMGVVYRAVDPRLGRPVALKFPLPGQRLDSQVRERFLREARAAGALDHPNICSIYEAGETEDGQLFLAMPLYPGETLKTRLSREGSLSIAESMAIAIQIARGLHAAHRAGVVHRDLKPANLMILSDGSLRILDFGVARVGDVTLTASHGALGTVSYMAPEQVCGERVDGRADLWALGVVLYEMLTGRRPFEGEHEAAIVHAIVHSDPVRPSAIRPDVGPGLEALLLALLAREPGRRRESAEAVMAELTALESGTVPSRVARLPIRLNGTGRWRRSLVWASSFVLVATAGGTTVWLLSPGAAGPPAEPRIVAMLPFEDLSGAKDPDYLALALPDEIGTRLWRLKAVVVPGEQSALEHQRSGKPDLDIARELGAAAFVRGSVHRAGDEVRFQVDLFEGGRNQRVWTREYRGPSNTVLALQQGATEAIVAALRLDPTPGERAELTRAPTSSAEAYDLYLRGRAAQIAENLQLAQSYYARARESDPDFAAPRARLALLHLALAGAGRNDARREQARLEAEAALRLQTGMPEAHEALASYWRLQGEPLKAIDELERALAGRPNAPHLYGLLGDNLRQLGRREEAADAYERASRLDPRNVRVHRSAALIYSRLRRYDEAIAHWDRVIAMDSADDPFPRIIRGFAYLRRGDVDSLDAAISRIPLALDSGRLTAYAHYTAHRIRGRHAEALASLDSSSLAVTGDRLVYRPLSLLRGQTLEYLGDRSGARLAYQAARRLLEDSVRAHPREPGMRIALGLAYAGLGRRADAMREARTAMELVPVAQNPVDATAFMGGAVEIYAQLGEGGAALELIELLLAMPAGREISVPLLRLDPAFDKLRGDPRFEALLARFSTD